MVRKKNSSTSAPRASAMAIDRARWRRFCSSVSTMPSSPSWSMSSSRRSHRPAKQVAEPLIGQEHREKQEEIEYRETEELLGCRETGLAFHPDAERDHAGARNDRDRAIERSGKTRKPRQRAERGQHQRIDQDLPPGLGQPGDHRQHRDAGAGIVARAPQRQRPEMRRRPEKDDEEHDERLDADAARGRRPSD